MEIIYGTSNQGKTISMIKILKDNAEKQKM